MAGEAHSTPVLASWIKAGGRAAERARFYRVRPREELYDLKNDPLELDNLAGRSEFSEMRRQLRTRLHAWMKQQGDEGIATEMLVKAHRRK